MRAWLDFAVRPGAGAWTPWRASTVLALVLALAACGCAAATPDEGAQAASPRASPPLYHAPGDGYVPGSSTYHGTGGP